MEGEQSQGRPVDELGAKGWLSWRFGVEENFEREENFGPRFLWADGRWKFERCLGKVGTVGLVGGSGAWGTASLAGGVLMSSYQPRNYIMGFTRATLLAANRYHKRQLKR